MKKVLKLLTFIFSLFLFISSVNAASATISVNTSASQVIVGNNVNVSVTISSSSALGSWEYNLNYDKNIFTLVSSDVELHYAGVVQNANTKSVTYRYTFKAKKSGSASFYIDASSVIGFDESVFSVTNGKRNVKVITYAEYQSSLSNNNNLKSLTVEGSELTPEFNKDVTEYTVSVNADTSGFRYDTTGDANGVCVPSGLSFAAVRIDDGLTLWPNMSIEITSVKVNGSEVPLTAKNYTSSDDGVKEVRANIYNSYVPTIPEDAHTADGNVYGQDDTYKAQIVDPAAFADGWSTVEVTFNVTGTQG